MLLEVVRTCVDVTNSTRNWSPTPRPEGTSTEPSGTHVPEPVAGASFTSVTLMVTVMVSSVAVSALPASFLLSRTDTVTV